jgi:hypothetical protein
MPARGSEPTSFRGGGGGVVTSPHTENEREGQRFSNGQIILKYIYLYTTGLCMMMVFWILLLPGSWLMGRSKLHDDIVLRAFKEQSVTPIEIVTKYQGHTLVQLTHILPAFLWAGVIPFQLHPTFRRNNPKIHRRLGYIFSICAILMSLGVLIILKRGLSFEHFFADLPPPPFSSQPFMVPLAMYFAWTALYSIQQARNRKFVNHQKWMIRHIASGMWVAVQRFLIVTVYSSIYSAPISRSSQRDIFTQAAFLGMVISFVLGEYTVYLLSRPNNNSKKTL